LDIKRTTAAGDLTLPGVKTNLWQIGRPLPKENTVLQVGRGPGAFIDVRPMLYQFIVDKSVRVIMSRIRFIADDHVIRQVPSRTQPPRRISRLLCEASVVIIVYIRNNGRELSKREQTEIQ